VGGGGGASSSSHALLHASAEALPFDRNRDEDRAELVAVIVHTSDLSGQAYPSACARNWSNRVLHEFRAQAAKERAQGLPVAPFMAALDTPLQCARLQLSFVANIVLPLWQRVAELLPGLGEPLSNLQSARLWFEAEVSKGPCS
jgi:high affinity cGMP-specific 3',5'-cyclic phosphodiesterase 9